VQVSHQTPPHAILFNGNDFFAQNSLTHHQSDGAAHQNDVGAIPADGSKKG
jgi:hypothetical protein